MKVGYIFSLVFLGIGIVFGVVLDLVIFPMLWQMFYGHTNPVGLGWGTFFGVVGSISLILYLDWYWFDLLPWDQGRNIEEVERVEEKDDFKNLDWLKHQYYDLGKTIQVIANEQGVSMITIRKWLDKLESR